MPAGRQLQLDNGDVAAVRDKVREVAVVAPRNQLGGFGGGNNVTRGRKAGAFNVNGDYPSIAAIRSVDLVEGRFLDPLDISEQRKVAVIGTRVRDLLFEKGETVIGGSVEIRGVYFQVMGVFGSRQSGDQAEREVQTIFVPFTTFQRAFNFGNRVGWLAVTSNPDVPASVAEDRVLDLLRARHRVAPDDSRAFGHYNLAEEYLKLQNLFAGIRILVWLVGSGTLAAGAIGVSNIMLIIVKERTKEIGVRRAVGARPLAIVTADRARGGHPHRRRRLHRAGRRHRRHGAGGAPAAGGRQRHHVRQPRRQRRPGAAGPGHPHRRRHRRRAGAGAAGPAGEPDGGVAQ